MLKTFTLSVLLTASALGLAVGFVVGCTRQKAKETPPPSVVDKVPAAPRVPSFKREISPWLSVRCASAESCHGRDPTQKIHLDLRPATAWAELVNHPAEERRGSMRIRPGDLAASFVVAKLTGQLRNREGSAMPRDPDTGMPPSVLPEEPDFFDNALKPWILAGAPNN